ncbi:MarR family winged helix-turn-helix transcriptional regulator [Cohnella sp.]|uniref:MarR family winged helix-turn-helix transcriptional regulator n=1 Tax=Cohnella sp. TaxID=1883426 RepID=UPI0035648579
MDSHNKDAFYKQKQLAEFQEVFGIVFRKLKKQNEFFPETEYKLASGHMLILLHIFKKGTCIASDISSFLGITSGGVTGLTDTLIKNNLIKRTRLENDRRVVQLSLTEDGQKIVEQIIEKRAEKFIQLFNDLDENEIEQILHIFQKLNSVLK